MRALHEAGPASPPRSLAPRDGNAGNPPFSVENVGARFLCLRQSLAFQLYPTAYSGEGGQALSEAAGWLAGYGEWRSAGRPEIADRTCFAAPPVGGRERDGRRQASDAEQKRPTWFRCRRAAAGQHRQRQTRPVHWRSLPAGIKANSRMAENLYRKAMGDGPQAVAATIFWLKTRARWKKTTVQEVAGPPSRLILSWRSSSATPAPDRSTSPALIDMTPNRE